MPDDRLRALLGREQVLEELRIAVRDMRRAEGSANPLFFLNQAQQRCRLAEALIEDLKRRAELLRSPD